MGKAPTSTLPPLARLAAELKEARKRMPAAHLSKQLDLEWQTTAAYIWGMNSQAPTMGKLWVWAASHATDAELREYAATRIEPPPARDPWEFLRGTDT